MKIKSGAHIISAFVAIVQNLQTSGVSAALCTAAETATRYNAIKAQISACEAKTSVTMELPLTAKKKQTICASCPELAAQANAQTLPNCKIVQASDGRSFKLQKQFERLFMPCITITTSNSGSNADTTTTTAPAAVTPSTPTVTPVTANPAVTPAPAVTTTTAPNSVTSKPQTTTAAPSESTTVEDNNNRNEGGTGLALEESGTVEPSTGTTASKSATKSSNSADWDPTSGSSSNKNSTSETTKQTANSTSGSFATVEFAAAIAGGVLAVVLVSVIIVLAWRRHHHHRDFEPDKRGNSLSLSLDSSTSGSQQMPFQFSVSTASTDRVQKWKNHNSVGVNTSATAPSTMRVAGNLWEDEVIVAARIPKDKVMVATLLSRGGFGEVYRGMYNHQHVAIKMLLPETRKNLKEISAFLAEVKLMATLEHERITQFIGVAWDSLNDICVVSEFMEGGDLKGVLGTFEEQQRPYGFDHTKVKIALHIAHALTYMHSLQPIVLHRDLKSKNILLDTELRAKLTDFGVSRERSDTTMTAAVGTSLWMAPEVMMGGRYDDKADVFSFGIVLSELDTHAIPYGSAKESGSGRRIPDSAVLQMIALGRLKVKFTPNAHPEMAKLGNACVSLDPNERPSASEVLYQLHTMLKDMYVVI